MIKWIDLLAKKGFGVGWRKWIWSCVSTTNFSIFIDRRPLLREGLGKEILFLLFTLLIDAFSRLLHFCLKKRVLKGSEVGTRGEVISHLQYVDNIECMAWEWSVFAILMEGDLSIPWLLELNLNLEKTTLICLNVKVGKVNRLAVSLGCKVDSLRTNYLGLPLDGNSNTIPLLFGILWLISLEVRLPNGRSLLSKGGAFL